MLDVEIDNLETRDETGEEEVREEPKEEIKGYHSPRAFSEVEFERRIWTVDSNQTYHGPVHPNLDLQMLPRYSDCNFDNYRDERYPYNRFHTDESPKSSDLSRREYRDLIAEGVFSDQSNSSKH